MGAIILLFFDWGGIEPEPMARAAIGSLYDIELDGGEFNVELD